MIKKGLLIIIVALVLIFCSIGIVDAYNNQDHYNLKYTDYLNSYSSIIDISWAPNNEFFAIMNHDGGLMGGQIMLYYPETQNKTYISSLETSIGNVSEFTSIDFIDNHRLAISNNIGNVFILNITTNNVTFLHQSWASISDIAVSHENDKIAYPMKINDTLVLCIKEISSGDIVSLINLSTVEPLYLRYPQKLSWSPDDSKIAFETREGLIISDFKESIDNITTNVSSHTMLKINSTDTMKEMSWSPTGDYIATIHNESWFPVNTSYVHIWNASNGNLVREIPIENVNWLADIYWSTEDMLVISANSEDKDKLFFIDGSDYSIIEEITDKIDNPVRSGLGVIELSPDNQMMVVSTSGHFYLYEKGPLEVRDVALYSSVGIITTSIFAYSYVKKEDLTNK